MKTPKKVNIYAKDVQCPIHRRAKRIMLDLRHHASKNRTKVDIKSIQAEIIVMKHEIASLEYEYLKNRKDLLFFLKNAMSTKDKDCRRNLMICHSMVLSAVNQYHDEKKGYRN